MFYFTTPIPNKVKVGEVKLFELQSTTLNGISDFQINDIAIIGVIGGE